MMRRLIYIWAGISAVVIFGLAIVFAVMWSRGLGARAHPSELESNVAMSVWESSIPSRYSKMKSPLTQVELTDAAGHYEEHCAVCHGDDGAGHTKFEGTMDPPPPDLRSGETQEMSDGELYWVIKNGVRWSGMPAFGAPGDNDAHAWKIVAFLRHLPKLTPQELNEMKQAKDDGHHE